MKYIKAIFYYLLIVFERILLIPFSNVRPCTMLGVYKNEFEKERLWRRVWIGVFILLIIILLKWLLSFVV
jgi:hypothetical protein